MKLRQITETRSNEPIRDAADSMGDLISFIKETPDSEEHKALMSFLSRPSFRAWDKTKWIVNNAIKYATSSKDPKLINRAKKWAFLNNLTDPTVASSVYDIEPKLSRGTPASRYSQSKTQRDKLKKTMGPLGYVSLFSNLGKDTTPAKINKLVKDTSNNSLGTTRAAKKDLPNVKTVSRF